MAGRFSAAQVSSEPDKSPNKTILLGDTGEGKTWLASTITGEDGSPVFFQAVEQGCKGHCPDARPAGFRVNQTWIAPESFAELLDALDTFQHEVNAPREMAGPNGPTKRRPFRHYAIDSLSGIERLVHEAACAQENVRHMEGVGYKVVWSAALPLWQQVQAKLDEIQRTGVHIWLIAHATEVFESSLSTGETFRKWDLLLRGSSKTLDDARHIWKSWADNVWFLSKDISVIKGDKGKRTIAKLGGRVLLTRETGTAYAKSRIPVPARIVAAWPDIQHAILGRTPERPDKARREILAIAAQLEPGARAEIERDFAAAKTATQIASVLSRAQGMRAMLDEDELSAPAPATSDPAPANDDGATPDPTTAGARTPRAPVPSYTNGAAHA